MRQSLAVAACCAGLAAAHGHVKEYIIDGLSYPAFDPSIDYRIDAKRVEYGFPQAKGGVGPVENVNGLDINCRFRPLKEPGYIAEARAGSNVTFKWFDWFGNHKGPLMTVSKDKFVN
jgi:cellulase